MIPLLSLHCQRADISSIFQQMFCSKKNFSISGFYWFGFAKARYEAPGEGQKSKGKELTVAQNWCLKIF
jgi:hypothetical protein